MNGQRPLNTAKNRSDHKATATAVTTMKPNPNRAATVCMTASVRVI